MMSAKKGAPALYELYHSGKPLRQGLFSRKKKNVDTGNNSDVSAGNPQVTVNPEVNDGPAFSSSMVVESTVDDSPGCFAVADRRVNISLPYWLFFMMIIAVLMCFLASYKLGTNAGNDHIVAKAPIADAAGRASEGKTQSNNTTAPSDEMQAALESQAYPGLITGTVKNGNNSTVANSSNSVVADSSVFERPARCLIVFGHNNPEDLKIVRDFFETNGLELDIAKRGREYVLVTRKGFTSSRETIYQVLKDKIYSIGEKYIVNRPEGGIRINLTTFRSSYPIDSNKLDYNIRL